MSDKCYRCNTTKLDRTMNDFINYCEYVYKKFKGGETS